MRNLSFEIIRIFAMVLIVLSHVISRMPWNLQNYPIWGGVYIGVHEFTGQVGVCLFFMVTGYFMVSKSFTVSRIVKVAVQTWCYALFCFMIWMILYIMLPAFQNNTSHHQLLFYIYQSCFPILSSAYWFVTAYIVLLIFSPALNLIIKHLDSCIIMSILLLMCIFSITPLFSFELYWNNFTYAVICYILGGCIHHFDVNKRIKFVTSTPVLICIWVTCLIVLIAFVYITEYLGVWDKFVFNSGNRGVRGIIPVLEIIPAAMLISRVHKSPRPFCLSIKWERLTRKIAAHTFGIYLLHTNAPLVAYLLWNGLLVLVPFPKSALMVISEILLITIGIFVVSLLFSILIDNCIVKPIQKNVLQLFNKFRDHCAKEHARDETGLSCVSEGRGAVGRDARR